jgi:hypothetical protein
MTASANNSFSTEVKMGGETPGKRNHRRTGNPRGKPPFKPTDEQRRFVAAMAE